MLVRGKCPRSLGSDAHEVVKIVALVAYCEIFTACDGVFYFLPSAAYLIIPFVEDSVTTVVQYDFHAAPIREAQACASVTALQFFKLFQ